MVVLFCLWVPMKVMVRTGNAGVSSSKPNVVNIGALYTFNSVIRRSAKPAIEAAVDDVNSDSTVLVGMNTHKEKLIHIFSFGIFALSSLFLPVHCFSLISLALTVFFLDIFHV